MFKLCVVLVSFAAYAAAVSPEERDAITAFIGPLIAKCSSEFATNPGDIEAAKKSNSASNLNPCFIGCMFKESGIINDKGEFDSETGKEKAKQFFKSEEDLNKINSIVDACTSINTESVSDDKGCERAKLLMDCFTKNSGGFTPFI